VQEGQVARVPTAGVWGLPCQERGPRRVKKLERAIFAEFTD
jgi:hypothetical protein